MWRFEDAHLEMNGSLSGRPQVPGNLRKAVKVFFSMESQDIASTLGLADGRHLKLLE